MFVQFDGDICRRRREEERKIFQNLTNKRDTGPEKTTILVFYIDKMLPVSEQKGKMMPNLQENTSPIKKITMISKKSMGKLYKAVYDFLSGSEKSFIYYKKTRSTYLILCVLMV